MSATARTARIDNRRVALLDAAATVVREHGYRGASMRDIARRAGMLPGSIYYHFDSKAELLRAVYEEGVRRIEARIDAALEGVTDPWARLEAACTAHLEMILDRSDYAQVVIRVLPADVGDGATYLTALRDRYEARFRGLVAALPGAGAADADALRLLLLGALNWTQTWYRPSGDRDPAEIAHRFVACLRAALPTEEP